MPRKRGKISSYEKENRSKMLTQSEYRFLLRLKSVTVAADGDGSTSSNHNKEKKISESEYPSGYQHSLKHRLLNKMADMKQACKLLRELEPEVRKLP